MGVPTVLSTSPSASEVGVYKNAVLQVTFSEAILESSVSSATFLLRDLDLNELVPVDVTVAGAVVSIVPIRLLLDNTAYRLSVIGADLALSTGAVKSDATSDDLVTTLNVSFRTGTEIQVDGLEKTEAQIEAEGDLVLPSNIQIIDSGIYLTVLDTEPNNREFGVDTDISSITVQFSEDLDTSSISASTVQVQITAYYEEDEDFLAYPDTSDCTTNFKFEEPADDNGVALDFSDPLGVLAVAGDTLTWTPDLSDHEFPRNSKVTVILRDNITGVSGKSLENDQKFVFYIRVFPDVVSVERIRDAFFPYVLSGWTDDLIGKTIYKNAMEALHLIRWQFDFCKVNKIFREYVLYSTIVDVFNTNRLANDANAGQFKRLGDLAIKYNSDMVEAIPPFVKTAMKKAKELKDVLTRRFSGTLRTPIKGHFHPEQRLVWRTRLWRRDIYAALQGYTYPLDDAGNTTPERDTKGPGIYDGW